MNYEGYIARVDFDEQADLFHGQVINLRDVITFQGRSVAELRQAFADSVEDYLEFCTERGEAPEKPFSGRFVLRVPPAVHQSMANAAARQGKSLNAWAKEVLEVAADAVVQSPFHKIDH
jgi:predicted HicB family RNase H-like nuclease